VVDPAFTDPTGTTFVQIEALGAIPVGTRKIKVRLDIDQVSGATPNLAIDDVTLEIDPGDLRYLTFAVWQVALRSVRLPAPMERGACTHGECATCHAPLDRHRRGHLPDGVASNRLLPERAVV
jgi:hypothetical protein